MHEWEDEKQLRHGGKRSVPFKGENERREGKGNDMVMRGLGEGREGDCYWIEVAKEEWIPFFSHPR